MKRFRNLALAGVAAVGAIVAGASAVNATELTARTTGISTVARYAIVDGRAVALYYPGLDQNVVTSAGQRLVTAPGQTVTFEASDNDNIIRYSWDFGDGTYMLGGPTMTHTYTYPGTYTVRVNTVTAEMRDEFAYMTVVVGNTGTDGRYVYLGSFTDRQLVFIGDGLVLVNDRVNPANPAPELSSTAGSGQLTPSEAYFASGGRTLP